MVKFDKFKLINVLNWQPQHEIDPLKIPELPVDSAATYPFYGPATLNNGISSYLSLTEKALNNPSGKPTILIHSNNQNIVYLETPFYLKDGHGATSVLQSEFLNEKTALYLMASIKKAIANKFSYNKKATKIALKNTQIVLPIDENNHVNYKYMENYIKELENECMITLNSFFQTSGLNDSELSLNEKTALNKFLNSEIKYQPFKIGGKNGLFHIESSKKKFNANSIKFNGSYPYVARSSANNGIRGYINQDISYLNQAPTISFGQDTATIFYQEKPYFTGDKIKIMSFKERPLTQELACYLLTAMKKSFRNFSWGQTSFNEDALNNVEIELPISSPQKIDYDFIESFIKAQNKLLIKDVIKYKNLTKLPSVPQPPR